MQCSWNVWPQLPLKVWKSSGVITVCYEICSLFNKCCEISHVTDKTRYITHNTCCWMRYVSSFALLSPFLLCRQILLVPSLSIRSSPPLLCSSLLSRPAVMSKGQPVICLLLCCQCSCLLPRCLLALAFSCCPNKCEALHWNSWWRKDDLRDFISLSHINFLSSHLI